jgi:hypothetical protein
MGSSVRISDSQEGELSRKYDRLASLLATLKPERFAAFVRGLPQWARSEPRSSTDQTETHSRE